MIKSKESKTLTTIDQILRSLRDQASLSMQHGIMGQDKTKMAAAVPFNVVFGINETPLTHALETRRFDEALEYIDSRYGICLDEGFYQRIPLYIVLSGENSAVDGKAMPIHLKIARRLIERGKTFSA